jgi:hypothetical protein
VSDLGLLDARADEPDERDAAAVDVHPDRRVQQVGEALEQRVGVDLGEHLAPERHVVLREALDAQVVDHVADRVDAREPLLDLAALPRVLDEATQAHDPIADFDPDRVERAVALPAQHRLLDVAADVLVAARMLGHDAQQVDDA